MISTQFGGSYDEWKMGVQKNEPKARRALLWYLMTLEHPKLRFADTPDFFDDELAVEYSSKELTELRAKVEKSTLANKDTVLSALDTEFEEALERETRQPLPGKASSTS